MSDVQPEETQSEDPFIGEIVIGITESSVKYSTGPFSLPDVVFWIEVVKQMIMQQVTGANDVIDAGD
jgi:hypothetical protein